MNTNEQEVIEPEIVDNTDKQINKDIKDSKNKKFWAWIFFIAAIVYGMSPIDLIPDMPVVGWIDDVALGTAAFTNLIQQYFFQTNGNLNNLFRIAKYILISIAVLIFLIAVLIVLLIAKK
ncbi:MAG: DUF1232 domain-containing protein [Elusimicrobia bacterium]|nr:DUF1232 domain-containing protein [Elusimicrobiota bacterium]